MMRMIFSIVRIVAGILIFAFLVLPIKSEVDTLKAKKDEISTTESDAKQFAALGQDVVNRFQSLDPAQIERLKKMVPDTVDTVRFINDINSIAKKSGVTLKKVDYNPEEVKVGSAEKLAADATGSRASYGAYTLRFAISGTYDQFLIFIDSLENSLRLLDITDVSFSSNVTSDSGKSAVYEFNITTTSYWLKN